LQVEGADVLFFGDLNTVRDVIWKRSYGGLTAQTAEEQPQTKQPLHSTWREE
jgi:hypothetical protein